MFANEIRPRQCHVDHCRKTCDTVDVAQVGVLDVESGGLHCPKACLNLPYSYLIDPFIYVHYFFCLTISFIIVPSLGLSSGLPII